MPKNQQGVSKILNEDWTKIPDLKDRRRVQNRIAQRTYRKKLKENRRALSEKKATGRQSTNSQVEESRSQVLLNPEHNQFTPEMQGHSLLIFPKECIYNISPFGAGYAMMAGIDIPSLDTARVTNEGFLNPNVKSKDNENEVSPHIYLSKRE